MRSARRFYLRFPLFFLLLTPVALGQFVPDAPPAAQQPDTLKASARIVVVDVGVADSSGNPIKGLKASDFALKENGQPQTIQQFEAHTVDGVKQAELPKLAPNVFTNFTPTPSNGALNVLLLDALNTPMKDQSYVHNEILKYLKTQAPGTRMAIFGLNGQLTLLQGFTSDPATLKAAVEKGKNGPKASQTMDNAVTGDANAGDAMQSVYDSLANNPDATTAVANMQMFDAEMKSVRTQQRVQMTLDALNNLARYLSGLPGKKNLIWFSGSFPINILPDPGLGGNNAFSVMAEFADEFHQTTTMLARAQVAVYPIDARGLQTGQTLDASDPGTAMAAQRGKATVAGDQKFFNDTADENSTMYAMATETGGKAFINTNGLADAVQKVTAAGSNYYTLVYSPVNKDWQGEFRKVQVQMAKAGYVLSYRHGYYADDPDAGVKQRDAPAGAPLMLGGGRGMGGMRGAGDAATAAKPGGLDPEKAAMRAAMQFGGPGPTQILFKAAVNPATGVPEKEPVKGNRISANVNGPYERLVVYVAAVPGDFKITTTPEGKHRLAAELQTIVYNGNGDTLNQATARVVSDLDDKQFASVERVGLQFRQEISVPVKGTNFLRMGLHDLRTDHVGAVEIPVSMAERQKPLGTPDASPKAEVKPVTVNVDPSLVMMARNGAVASGPASGISMANGSGSGVGRGSGGSGVDGVRRIGGSVTAPIVVFQPEPQYTALARANKIAGNVLVYLRVSTEGLPTNIRVIRGLGYGLDESAIKAVQGYKFKPATENGQPVTIEMNVEVNFQVF